MFDLTKFFYRKNLLAHIPSNDEQGVSKLCWAKILPGETQIILSPILAVSEELAVATEMLNSLSQENLTEEEINGWIENDESLLSLEDTE